MGEFGGRGRGMQLEEVTEQSWFQCPDHECVVTAEHGMGRYWPLSWSGVVH